MLYGQRGDSAPAREEPTASGGTETGHPATKGGGVLDCHLDRRPAGSTGTGLARRALGSCGLTF